MTTRCHWCDRDTSDGDYVRVSLPNSPDVVRCCSTCWERGEEAIVSPLDMTEDES